MSGLCSWLFRLVKCYNTMHQKECTSPQRKQTNIICTISVWSPWPWSEQLAKISIWRKPIYKQEWPSFAFSLLFCQFVLLTLHEWNFFTKYPHMFELSPTSRTGLNILLRRRKLLLMGQTIVLSEISQLTRSTDKDKVNLEMSLFATIQYWSQGYE